MLVESFKSLKNTVITHNTIHGHIHTYDGVHRHIHGHLHKHQHTLPPSIDAEALMKIESPVTAESPVSDYSVSLSTSSTSDTSANLYEKSKADGPSFDLNQCQIQQIIDQCCENSLSNCFDCSENENILENKSLFEASLRDSSNIGITNCDHTHCPPTYSNFLDTTTPTNSLGLTLSNEEIKLQLQSLFDFKASCGEPDCIGSEAIDQGDKCFELCDFENKVKEIKTEDEVTVVTDIPDDYKILGSMRSKKSSSNLSDLRSQTSKTKESHKHIHTHDVLHHSLDHRSEPHVCKKRKLSGKVEQFHYNWINLNDTPLEIPTLRSHKTDQSFKKDHLHCLWAGCTSNLAKYATNSELQSHVLKDHVMRTEFLKQESKVSSDDQKIKNDLHLCEWLDCDFETDDLMKLLEHVPISHGFKNNSLKGSRIEEVDSHSHNHQPHHAIYSNFNLQGFSDDDDDDDDEGREQLCKWENEAGTLCNRQFLSTLELTNHILDDHVGSGNATYQCCWKNCSRNHKPFKQRQKIIRHLHVHTKHRPCVCKICGKKFSIDLMLEQHMRIHTGEKPFQCHICARWFKTSSSLSVHSRVHTGERPLQCKYEGCGKRFNESSNLTKHYKTHQRLLKCHACSKTFNSEKPLQSHLGLYHGIQNDEIFQALKLQHNGFRNPYHLGQVLSNED